MRNYARDFWAAASRGLAPLVLGPPGVYKSFGVAVLAEAVHTQLRVPVTWVNALTELGRLNRQRFTAETTATLQAWQQCPWLVLDDIGLVVGEPGPLALLGEIVHARYDAGLPTCYTANIRVDALDATLTPHVARRVYERSEGYRLYVSKRRAA